MSLHRFFLEGQVLADQAGEAFPLRLSADDAKHAKVLRLKPGEHIAVVDAASDYFECEIVGFDGDLPVVSIARRADAPVDRPNVVLFQGLAKGDKMETVIRHATELGVAGFVPVSFSRCVMKLEGKRAESKLARWRSIAKSAAMQSGQPAVPEIAGIATLPEACEAMSRASAVLVCWEEAPQSLSIGEALRASLAACACTVPSDARVAVVVGPEGGLSEREVEVLLGCNPRASLVSLGSSILRTETAGIVAPALALYELGCLGNASQPILP